MPRLHPGGGYGPEDIRAAIAGRQGPRLDLIIDIQARLHVNAELKAASVSYAKTRPVFEAYKASRYSKKFLAEHEAELAAYRVAGATFRRILDGAKLPRMDALKEEYRRLTAEKKELYAAYRAAREDMRQVTTAKANIDYLLGLFGPGREKGKER